MSPRVAIITNVIADYRMPFYERLIGIMGDKLRIYCQDSIPGMNLRTCHHQLPDNVEVVKCWSLAREKMAWQWLPLLKLLRDHDVYVFTGNPRVLSTIFCATLLRLIGRPVVIWGQLHTAGANQLSEKIRLSWWRMFRYILLYTDVEAEKMKSLGFGTHCLIGINNGLDQKRIDQEKQQWSERRLSDWVKNQKVQERTIILSCARLEEKNKFSLMLEALPSLINRHPSLLWVVIGDGSEKNYLQQRSIDLGITNHVRWIGALHDESLLAPWFLNATLFVHPGAIGLSLLHAFGYGLPVITHNDSERHMPEFGAFPNKARPLCFKPEDKTALSKALLSILDDPSTRKRLSNLSLETVNRFNVDIMAERFITMSFTAFASDSKSFRSTAEYTPPKKSDEGSLS